MPTTYEVFLTTDNGTLLDIIDEWLSLKYVRTVNGIGTLVLVLPGSYDTSLLLLDGRIAVYRDGVLDTETTWLIRGITKKLDSNGRKTVEVEALSANEILDRRVIAYDSGTAQTNKTDYADNLMKAYVNENLGSAASPSTRSVASYLAIESSGSLGPTLSWEAAWDGLLDVLQDIGQSTITAGSAVYFDIVAPTLSTLEFRTYRGQRGNDHRYPNGINPVVLSVERGNLSTITRAYDWSDEITYVYAAGTGVGAARDVQTASSSDRIGQSAFNLREGLAQATGTTSGSVSLADAADAALRKGRPKRFFDATIVNVPGTAYGIEWGWGDLITAEYEGEAVDCAIDSIEISIAKGKENLRAVLRAEED